MLLGQQALKGNGKNQQMQFEGNFWNFVIAGKQRRMPTQANSKHPAQRLWRLEPRITNA